MSNNAAPQSIQPIVERLRREGADAFSQQYSLGMFKLCAEAADRIEELEKLLEPFAAHADRYSIGAPETADGYQVYVSLGECRAARAALPQSSTPARAEK